jgi:ribosomal protein L37AE/L43A
MGEKSCKFCGKPLHWWQVRRNEYGIWCSGQCWVDWLTGKPRPEVEKP